MTALFERIDRTPQAAPLHLWADWTELLCFVSEDGQISVPELAAKIEAQKAEIGLGPDPEEAAQDDAPDPLLDAINQEEPEPDEAGEDTQGFFERAVRARADDVMKYVLQRAVRYQDSYPFEVDAGSRTITLRNQSETRDLYLYLLTCSHFKYLSDKSLEGKFAAGFEVLSQLAVVNYLPRDATVRRFGANPYFSTADYEGLLREKIEQLAVDLGGLTVAARDKDFEANNSGDGGADLVAWMPIGDLLPGMPIFLGQCACTSKWVVKQHSSSYQTWRKLIHFPDETSNWCFIPFDFRDLEQDWYSRTQIHSSVLFDRFRLMHLLAEPSTGYAALRVPSSLDLIDHSALIQPGRAQALADL